MTSSVVKGSKGWGAGAVVFEELQQVMIYKEEVGSSRVERGVKYEVGKDGLQKVGFICFLES